MADFVFMLLFGAGVLILFSLLIPGMFFLGPALVTMLIYIWSRTDPLGAVVFFGFRFKTWQVISPILIRSHSYYNKDRRHFHPSFSADLDVHHRVQLPFILMVFHTLLGGSIIMDLAGILAGHAYHFFKDIVPRVYNVDLIRTPAFIVSFFSDAPTVASNWRNSQGHRLN